MVMARMNGISRALATSPAASPSTHAPSCTAAALLTAVRLRRPLPSSGTFERHIRLSGPARRQQSAPQRHREGAGRCLASSDLGASFSEELERRNRNEAQQLEIQEAESFDGAALLEVIRQRYERSYDVTLARRTLAGKTFISLNIMWAYREQASFALTEEEHINRLDFAAEALRAWGQVRHTKLAIASQRSRPRMGKAISIQLEVPERAVQEWFGS